MTCDRVRELISAYHDGELEQPAAGQVTAHLETCRACGQAQAAISRLGRLLASLEDCHAPEDLWDRIAAGVSSCSVPGQPLRLSGLVTVRRGWLVAAASIALVTSLSSHWIAGRTWFAPAPAQPIQTTYGLALGVYVQELHEGRDAYERFLAVHQGRQVAPDELVRQVGFRPLVPEELPDGFRLDKSYVLATTCCQAVELRYVKGAQLVTIFQQGQGHPVLFDGFAPEPIGIDGVSCRRGQVGDIVIINWDGAGRNTTLLARGDFPRLETMVRFLNRTP